MPPVIYWFRQDLRLSDNAALSAAAAKGEVIPLFILDDETPGNWRCGAASRWWLHHSLTSLRKFTPLVLRRGRADVVLREVLQSAKAQAIYFARDYAPWSGALEQRVKAISDELGVECHRHGGFLLHEPEAIRNGSGEPYRVYTPFARACFASGEPRLPKPAPKVVWAKHSLVSDDLASWTLLPARPNWAKGFEAEWQPGEQGAQARLKHFITQSLPLYAERRDIPSAQATSRLSPHLHWGEISPHQAWHSVRAAMGSASGSADAGGEKFLKELLWREFSCHLLHHFPHLPDRCFRAEFEGMPWAKDDEALRRWQQGKTGFPIVDAGMRELWATGSMHNRVRMIVASFLIKHLQIDWREGQRWFWDTLVDADLASNAASWQWVAGCGADAAPYYRIFNPGLQAEKFDPQGEYIRRWVPELRASAPTAYPLPMVDHVKARVRALAAFASIKN